MSSAPRLLLPPPFQATLVGEGDIVELATQVADQGAGTLLWRDQNGVLAFAVVLEPGPPLANNRDEAELGFAAGVAALCDALARHGQPERKITVEWPDRVIYDNALIAGARWRAGPMGEDGLPEWVIFAAEITSDRAGLEDPGLYPNSSSLREEEFPDSASLIETFAAFFKLIVDRWGVEGAGAVLRRVLDRVEGQDALKDARIEHGTLKLPPLAETLKESEWRDDERGGPAW